jgi:probable HAF family extracellular repeat protein
MTFGRIVRIALLASLGVLASGLIANGGGTTASGQSQTGAAAQITTYAIADLGTLGGDNSAAVWITNSGDVIGHSETGDFDSFGGAIIHAFRWRKGIMEDLGTLGDVNSTGLGGNSKGEVVGNNWYNINRALLWYNGASIDLGTLVGPDGFSWAQQVNDEGQAVGASAAPDGTFHAVLWNYGAISDLGTLGGPNSSTYSLANGINDLGQVVGDSQQDTIFNPLLGFPPFFPALWDKNSVTKLGGAPGYAFAGDAFNINNKSQVVGRIGVADPNEGAVAHAYFWEAGVMRDLGVPAGDDNSEANSLNDAGQVVGDSGVGYILGYSPDRALLWQNDQWIDLNTLIPAGSGYQLVAAFDVNARGQIVVSAVQLSTGNMHAVLLTPQPSSVAGNAVTGGASGRVPPLSERAQRLLALGRGRKTGFKTQN